MLNSVFYILICIVQHFLKFNGIPGFIVPGRLTLKVKKIPPFRYVIILNFSSEFKTKTRKHPLRATQYAHAGGFLCKILYMCILHGRHQHLRNLPVLAIIRITGRSEHFFLPGTGRRLCLRTTKRLQEKSAEETNKLKV